MTRLFLLSPAHSGGSRAAMLTRPQANFELARQVQIGAASLGAVFAFCSGLYFRGKLAYAQRFAQPPHGISGALVITPSRGLVPAETTVGLRDLQEFAAVPVDSAEPRFTTPLVRSIATLPGPPCEVVLLGSIATGKYVDTLLPLLGSRLRFPAEFVGRGDMSRGALMLQRAESGDELEYIPVEGSIRHGRRAARIATMRSARP